jgi:isopenicillin N synthase-like dioxygenase
VEIGFFQVSHHGIPLADIRQAFSMTEAFFDLPDEVKRQYPLAGNAGWESKAQVRPSTRTPDQKESYQITRPLMAGRWPSDRELPASSRRCSGLNRSAGSWG